MRGVLGDARIVKYLAALDSGLSLVGYDPDFQVLYVPLGADPRSLWPCSSAPFRSSAFGEYGGAKFSSTEKCPRNWPPIWPTC